MGNKKELLLVHTSMDRVALTQSVDIMLTPQFYTLKKEALPIKYAYQAKKIAPSLFDGLLDNGSYEYIVEKEESGWAFIAYDIESIGAFLESKGIVSGQVGKIYFAQQSLESFSSPLALNEKEALVALEDTVVLVPRSALGESEMPVLDIKQIVTPKQGVTLKGVSSALIGEKQAYALAAIFMLFAGVFFVEGSRYGGDTKEIQEELAIMYESYPTLKSTYAREGIIEKYRLIDKHERKKREAVKAFSGMIFKGVTLTSLNIGEKGFSAQFTCASNDVVNRVKELAKKAKYNTSKVSGSNDLRIEGKL